MGLTTHAYSALAKPLSKDCINDQTNNDITVALNTAGVAFDASQGLGDAANTSSIVLLMYGGFDAQRCTCVLNFPSPTTAGTEDLGVIIGLRNYKSTFENYLYARVHAGTAGIAADVNGTLTTLTSTPWSVAQGVNITIMIQRVGLLVTTSFTAASGPSPVTPSTILTGATATALASGGLMGFRSLSKAVWCRSMLGEQVA